MLVEFKVIDKPLDYNLLLGFTWVYAMAIVVSTYFKIIVFPHSGGIVAIDQLTLFATSSQVTGSTPLVGETPHPYQHVGVGFLKDSSLLGTFFLPPPLPHSLPKNSNPVSYVNMIYCCTTPSNPWIVPNE